jgi:SAM-dependent methyltransferase
MLLPRDMNERPRPETVFGRGQLDPPQVGADRLHVTGWVATSEPEAMVDCRLWFAGRERELVVREGGLPSPDLAGDRHRFLHGTANARFHVAVPITPADLDLPARDRNLVRVMPVFARGDGPLLTHVLHQDIPLPGEREADLARIVGSWQPGAGFAVIAYSILGLLIQRTGLEPTDRVLDIGCGMGRLAYALAHYLDPATPYLGLDVHEELLHWARRHVGTVHPNFRFARVDAQNTYYNPRGGVRPGEQRVPCDDGSVDLVLVMSVFTHLRGADVRRYLAEVRRVLRPGGRCLCTFLVVDDHARRRIAEDERVIQLVHPWDDGLIADPALPEYVVGFRHSDVLEWIAASGLVIEDFRFGAWSAPRPGACFRNVQDAFVLRPASG